MNLNDAGRIIEVIDRRVRDLTKSLARVETTWATVAGVAADHRTVSAYLYGETDSDYVSEDFRTVGGVIPTVGASIKVAMDKERSERWVEEVHVSSDYNRIELNPNTGEILLGTGTAAPDVAIYSPATAKLQVEGDLYVGTSAQPRWLYLMGGSAHIQFDDGAGSPDVSISRSAAGELTVSGDLKVTGDLLGGVSGVNVPGDLGVGGTLTLAGVVVFEYTGGVLTISDDVAIGGSLVVDLDLEVDGDLTLPTGSVVIGNNVTLTGGVLGFGSGMANGMLNGGTAGVLEVIDAELQSESEAWIAPSFTNSWVNYDSGFAQAAYRIDAQGYVHLRGLIKLGTVGSAAFTLPAGYRPGAAGNLAFATIGNGLIGRIDVRTDGLVVPTTPSSNVWLSLNGITFKAEA